MQIVECFRSLLINDEGVTAIEYGLIAALIAVFIIVSVTAVGSNVSALFDTVSTAVIAAV